MKVYITKYALTRGIIEEDVEVCYSISKNMVRGSSPTLYHKPYWHTSYEEALIHAEIMRSKKIVSLRRSLAKLEALTFKNDGL